MYKIGIIGTENSHAMAFARIINQPCGGQPLFPDVRVEAVQGADAEATAAVAEQAGVSVIAGTPEELAERVDAVMITSRRGSEHYRLARPLIRRGMPLFIDKPFTADPEQARRLVEEAAARDVPLCGGSGCKLAYDVVTLAGEAAALRGAGQLRSAALNFALDYHSPYDGLYFYAPHLVEIALTAFGPEVRELTAQERNGTVVSVWSYDDCDITLHFTKDTIDSTAVLFAGSRNHIRPINISAIYRQEVEMFIKMLLRKEMPFSYESLVRPVEVIAAMDQAIRQKKVVGL